ncbi:MAG TPA: ABC transporter ATP-binding protein [Bacteroidales bacterium]|nr:ABC transporter ATP-binding protein [Bacteroidales bacterium]
MTAIEFNNISKQYRLGLVSTRTLSHDLNRWWVTKILRKEDPYLKIGSVNDRASAADSDYVWALKDINFKVEQGDVVGIIGKNGAGKSTLLKLLSRVTTPTTGTIKARGRIASLLEVGTGFHPEMTGRENIYMNGAIMGMTKAEITRKLDEIVDFAGVERYIDTPVKRYSSGMMVRLGFAVAAHLDPEILVVDEVLAVGDAEFQKKAIGKMQDVSKGDGRTVLFVSHNMESMQQLCTKGILLKNGFIEYSDSIEDVVNYYQKDSVLMSQKNNLFERTDRKGNGDIKIVECQIVNRNYDNIDTIITGNKFILNVKLEKKNWNYNSKNVIVTVNISNSYGNRILHLSNYYLAKTIDLSNDIIQLQYCVDKFPLCSGQYFIGFYIADELNVLDWIENVKEFFVESGDYFKTGRVTNTGVFLIEHTIEQIS